MAFCFGACMPDNIELTERYPLVYNTHDVDQVMSLYGEDAVFERERFSR